MIGAAPIEQLEVGAYRIPTATPEADGTYEWDSTTLVTVHALAGGKRGFGYSYGSPAVVSLIREQLAGEVIGLEAVAIEAAWAAMVRQVRNVGRPGIAATAISAIDSALWDLKAKLLDVPLVTLLGELRSSVPVYGSGGFTSYSPEQLGRQLSGFVESGMKRVKMKVGADPATDIERVRVARATVGDDCELMVDANGAYSPQQALRYAHAFAEEGVSWLEEPVSSDNLPGLRLVRERAPVGMAITAGEYGFDPYYFLAMLEAQCVDVLQADATRCLGITGFVRAAALCDAFQVPLSAHTAPSIHCHVACSVPRLIHIEYFFDHARIEQMLFEGFVPAVDGRLTPDRSRSGLGVELKSADAAKYAL